MVHGLLWLPLLIFFFWITWAGWNEYQKVETYKQWATQFERSKYDIFAALGQRERSLTWGLPTRQGIINLNTAELGDIQSITLFTKGDGKFATVVENNTKNSEALIQLQFRDGALSQIPFTDVEMAEQWQGFLEKSLAEMGNPV